MADAHSPLIWFLVFYICRSPAVSTPACLGGHKVECVDITTRTRILSCPVLLPPFHLRLQCFFSNHDFLFHDSSVLHAQCIFSLILSHSDLSYLVFMGQQIGMCNEHPFHLVLSPSGCSPMTVYLYQQPTYSPLYFFCLEYT